MQEKELSEKLKILDRKQQVAILWRMGIKPIGSSGCTECDFQGFIYCCCARSGGGSEGGEKSEIKDTNFLFKDISGKLTRPVPHKSFFQESMSSKIDKIPELTIFVENTGKKLSEEEIEILKKIFSQIELVFKEFIKELKNKGFSVKDYTIELEIKEDNMFVKLNIPNAEHHDKFIKRLVKEKLLPTLEMVPQAEKEPSSTYKSPTPFKMKLTPYPQ